MTIEACLAILDIQETPTKTVIKKAFRKAARLHHPDTRGSDAQFIKVKLAYDTLMSATSEELSQYPKPVQKTTASGRYDPFTDPDYASRQFFVPENPATEGFERKLRAKNCPHCGGYGFVTKNTNPAKGFAGRETRLCKCQWA